jgi:hypothetical protein
MKQEAAAVTAVTDASNVTSESGGLQLPRVQLQNTATMQPFIEPGDPDYTLEFRLRHAGLLVYNITSNSTLEPGIYIWTGLQWATYTTTVPPSSIIGQPKEFTFYELGTETPAALEFLVDGPGPWTYQWYRMISTNVNFHGGEKITALNASENGCGNGYDSPQFTPKVCPGTTRNANNCGFYRYYCIATSVSGVTFRSDIAEVAVGCGAKNNQGEWITFMCYNLGAQHGITINEQKNYSLSNHSHNNMSGLHYYTHDEEKVYGSLFQWGRIADDHEKRTDNGTSLKTAAAYGVIQKSDIGNGNTCSSIDASVRPLCQIKTSSTTWYGKFIFGPGNWNPYHDEPDKVDVLWRTGRFIANDPCAHYKTDGSYVAFWHEGTDQTDPGTGVCQDAGTGWKIPSVEEFGVIYKGGTIAGTPGTATANTWFWNDGGMLWGDPNTSYTKPAGYEIRPDNVTTTLFLPANGSRNASNAQLASPGANGNYWSGSTTGTNAYSLSINRGNVNPVVSNNRATGFGVRCIRTI